MAGFREKSGTWYIFDWIKDMYDEVVINGNNSGGQVFLSSRDHSFRVHIQEEIP